jgi:macrolide-specific efflux system membrane fusion protein
LALLAYADVSATLLDTARVLDATASDSEDLSVDAILSFKATISASLASLISDGTALTNASQALDGAEAALTDDVASAENALASIEAGNARDDAASAFGVASRSADLARAEAALASLVASPRDVDVAALRASVAAAQADQAGASARLRKTQIVAPIDGIVTAIALDAGESAVAGQTAVTVLSSGTQFQVSMDVPESDVSKIHAGDSASVTFDALGDARAFEGTVAKIDPAQKLIEGVVFYEATVLLASGQDLSLVRPGMSSNVTVRAAEFTDALSVPSRSVLVRDGSKYVRLQAADGTIEEREVQAGLHADGGRTQILSGLEEGETVVVSLVATP